MPPKTQSTTRASQAQPSKAAKGNPDVKDFPDPRDDDEKSGRLVFRTSPEIHGNIAAAADQMGMSTNAWMQAILSEAASDVLGLESGTAEIASPDIKRLIEDPAASETLFDSIVDLLEKDDARTIFRFVAALKKLLIGLDAVQPFLQGATIEVSADLVQAMSEKNPASVKLAAAVMPFLEVGFSDPRFTAAIKKLMIGIKAVRKFLKEEKSVLSVIYKVDVLLKD